MSIITFDRAPAGNAEAPVASAVARPGFWGRMFGRFVEARQRKAAADIRRYHRSIMPPDLDDAGWKIGERSDGSLPFVR